MATTGSIKLEMTTDFKGGLRVWSNRHHFSGGLPADAGHWATLTTNVVNSLKACWDSHTMITGVVGYAAGSDVPVYSNVLSTSGTTTLGTNEDPTPLGNVAIVRWSTSARSVKNHPIYAFSFVHDVWFEKTSSSRDKLSLTQKSHLTTFASDWVSGFSDGTHTLVRCTAGGHDATGSVVEEWISHRDFPYQSSV